MYTNAYGYVYDPIGNRLFAAFNSVTNSYTANCLNQYTGISGGQSAAPTYDLDGNMLTFGEWAYSWDGENRMIGASNATTVVCSAYDHQSRRIRKVVGNENRIFIYDGWNLTAEVAINTATAVTNITRYVWGLDLSGSLQGAGGVGGLLAVIKGDGSVYYPCFDANGNITAYVNDQGAVVAHREYDPFGKTVVATGSLVHDLHFWFSTKYLDEETGLYYFGYRYYSPDLGRWMNRDLIEESGGENLYLACLNSPVNIFDLLGLVGYRVVSGANKNVQKVEDIEVARITKTKQDLPAGIDFSDPSMAESEPASDGYFANILRFSDGNCMAEFVLAIKAAGSATVKKGQRYIYQAHVKGNDGKGVSNGPVDEVLAHERGHAKAWMEVVKIRIENYFKVKYAQVGDRAFTAQEQREVQNFFEQAVKEDTFQNKSAQYANDGSIGYFENKSLFTREWPSDAEFKKEIIKDYPAPTPGMQALRVRGIWIGK